MEYLAIAKTALWQVCCILYIYLVYFVCILKCKWFFGPFDFNNNNTKCVTKTHQFEFDRPCNKNIHISYAYELHQI